MKCLRCGYCCFDLLVVIVDDPAKGIAEDNMVCKSEPHTRCQHLRGRRSGEYSCAIHDEPWYPETPCFQHTQVERSPDDPCRMGVFILKKNAERVEMDCGDSI